MDYEPKVSIGLAVFNGEKYLNQAIDSILAQTYTDFELIIADNASQDGTEKICRQYAAQDSRIRYFRNQTNIGGVNNENLTFKLSRGKYYRLMAHDDVLAPELIAKSVQVLEENSELILCYSDTVHIDSEGQHLRIIDYDLGCQDQPFQRFRQLARYNHGCEITYALIRSDILRPAELQLNYPHSDRSFLAQLGLLGKFYKIKEPLFYKRLHLQQSIQAYKNVYERMVWFYPYLDKNNLPYDCYFIYWRQIYHFIVLIHHAPIDLKNKLLCYFHVITLLKRKCLITEIFILISKNPLFDLHKVKKILNLNSA